MSTEPQVGDKVVPAWRRWCPSCEVEIGGPHTPGCAYYAPATRATYERVGEVGE